MTSRAIALTGGPCGGKTTLIAELRRRDPRGQQFVFTPEAVLALLDTGLDRHAQPFQRAVVELQIATEEACLRAAPASAVLVAHRGALDPLAFWLRNGWDAPDFFKYCGASHSGLMSRYHAVLHLESVACNATMYYVIEPHTHRREALEVAAATDALCGRAWSAHPKYVFLGNQGLDWSMKCAVAMERIRDWRSEILGASR